MNTKLLSTIILLLFTSLNAKSQIDSNKITKNIIYIEGAGIGGYGSLNYERVIIRKTNLSFYVRGGLSTYNLKDYTTSFNPDIIIPMAINGLYGTNHKMEFGIGQTITSIVHANYSTWQPDRETNFHANFTIGYRFQKETGGMVFRINYSPIIEFYRFYRHWGGISLGFSF